MDLLCTHSLCPELGAVILSNVMHHIVPCLPIVSTEPKEKHSHGRTIIFPECGSAFHEWEVVCTLVSGGHDIAKIVFMDSALVPEWVMTWCQLAEVLAVEIVVLYSYVALEQWAWREISSSPHSVIVLYINGSIRFTPYYCGHYDVEECKASASRFGDWCHQFAINQSPINYVRHSALRLAGCTTWT